MLTLDGLEIIAVLVVMGLFIKVLEQFGMFEPVGGEGNGTYGRFEALLTIDKLWFAGRQGGCVSAYVSWHLDLQSPIPSGPERAAVLSEGLGYSSASQPLP